MRKNEMMREAYLHGFDCGRTGRPVGGWHLWSVAADLVGGGTILGELDRGKRHGVRAREATARREEGVLWETEYIASAAGTTIAEIIEKHGTLLSGLDTPREIRDQVMRRLPWLMLEERCGLEFQVRCIPDAVDGIDLPSMYRARDCWVSEDGEHIVSLETDGLFRLDGGSIGIPYLAAQECLGAHFSRLEGSPGLRKLWEAEKGKV